MYNPQFNAARRPIHLLTPEGWPRVQLCALLDRIDQARTLRPECPGQDGLRVLQLFYSHTSVGMQALRLAASWRNWSLVQAPRPLDANRDLPRDIASWCAPADLLVMLHPASGAAHAVASTLDRRVPIINMLDGMHAAPLAALMDVAKLRRRLPELNTRSVALYGDLVADARLRSVVHILTTLGVPKVNVVHAGSSLPLGAAQLGVHVFTASESAAGFEGAEVILRFPSAGGEVNQGEGKQALIDLPVMMHGVPDAHDLGNVREDTDAGTNAVFEHACVLVAVADTLMGEC